MFKAILLSLFIIFSLHAKVTEVSLLLPWKNQFQFAGYYMAKEKGFYEEAGLLVNLKEFDLKRDNAKDVASGKYEFGVKHSGIILDILNKHKNLILLAAINQSSPLVLLCKKRDDIKSLEDIKNKTIMMSSEDAQNTSILAMLSSKSINPNSYKVINTSFDLNNLINDVVDMESAYLSNELFVLQEEKIDYTIFNPKDYGYNFYSDILFTSKEFINTQPKVVKAFYKASMKGWEYAYSHIDESIDTILKHYNTQNRTKAALLYEANALKKLAFKKDTTFGNINPIRLEEIINTYRLLGLTKSIKKLNYHNFIYKENVLQAQEENIEHMLKQFYKKNQNSIYSIIFSLLFIISIILFLIFTMNRLLKKQKKELEKHYEMFDKNIPSSRTDLKGNITHVTDALCKATGYTKNELIGKNQRIFKDHNDTNTTNYKDLWLTITSGHTWKGEFHNVNKNGSSYWTYSIISPIFSDDKKIIGYEGIREDITIKKVLQEFNEDLEEEVYQRTHELKKSETYLDTLFDINPHIAYVLQDDKLERVNRAFLKFTQSDSIEVFLQKHECICDIFEEKSKNNQNKKEHFIYNECIGSHCTEDTKVIIKRDNKNHIFNLTTQEFTIENETRCLIVLEDITELEKISVTDKLTGLYNRIKIDDEISVNYQYYKEFSENFSLILIDIDFFKTVNDNYGHLIGDEILKEMALVAQNSIRSTDILARWGGEEFMIICPNTDVKNAFKIAQGIRKNIEVQKFSRDLKITISAGVSDMASNKDINMLIDTTDKALYKAKDNGRNRVEL